jgi:hypothetical protein
MEPIGTTGSTTRYNEYFGVSRFTGRTYYGGHRDTTNDDNWFTFTAGGIEFVVVSLAYDTTPTAAQLDWARSIFDAHPTAFGIANSHYIVTLAGTFGPQGQAMYDRFRDAPNVHIMTCGHIAGEARRSDTFAGHTIHSMLADYQGRAMGGSGWMRLWEFSPANDEITVRTYSPGLDRWETDADSEFTISIDLPGSSAPFAEVGFVGYAGTTASATYSGLVPGREYEWYARVTDCAHTVETPITRFTTAP